MAIKKKKKKTKAQPAKEAKAVKAEIVEESVEQSPDQLESEKAYPLQSEEDFTFEDESQVEKSLVPAHVASKALTSTDPLVIYLNEIRKYPLLTKEEESEVAKKYFETKDPEFAQKLVRSNLRFVVKIAAEYSKFGAKMIDLIQEGNVGLMHAVKEFNPYKGARIITYAVWWIRGYIQEYLMRQYSMVRIGTTQNQRKLFYQLQKEKKSLEQLGHSANLTELSTKLGIPADEIETMAQRLSGRDVSLDRPMDEDSGVTMKDLQRTPSDESLDEKLAREEQLDILKKKIEEIRPLLSDREKIILEERILNDEPLTLQEIGEKYGITREAVRQMESRVIKKIKDKMGAQP